MKVEIRPLDLDYEELDGDISIGLHGKTPDRKRVVAVDLAYEPYFYVLPKNLNKAKREIEATLQKRNVKVKRIQGTKKYFLGKREFIKVNGLEDF